MHEGTTMRIEVDLLVGDLRNALRNAEALREQIVASPTDPAKAELMGVKEVADQFGVVAHTVSTWVTRNRMPEPLARLASGPVWNRSQIESLRLERGLPAWPEEGQEQ